MPSTFTPQQFVAKWRGDTRKERSISQEHFIDLCRLLGHETPSENRDGTLAFEEGASEAELRKAARSSIVILENPLGCVCRFEHQGTILPAGSGETAGVQT